MAARGILDSYRQQQTAEQSAAEAQDGADDPPCSTDCVTEIFSAAEFDEQLARVSENVLVVVDFYRCAADAFAASQSLPLWSEELCAAPTKKSSGLSGRTCAFLPLPLMLRWTSPQSACINYSVKTCAGWLQDRVWLVQIHSAGLCEDLQEQRRAPCAGETVLRTFVASGQ